MKFGFKMFEDKVNTRIEALTKEVASYKKMKFADQDEYQVVRAAFNAAVLSTLVGVSIEVNEKGAWETKSVWKSIPDKSQTRKITCIINDYMLDVEAKYYSGTYADIDDDIKVVPPLVDHVVMPESFNTEEFKTILLDVVSKSLSINDFMLLAEMGEKLRKHNYRMFALKVVGTVAVVTVVTAGALFYKKSKSEETVNTATIPTSNDIDSDVVITIDDDVPVVIITDDDSDVTIIP